jgi:hypothetical protein
MRKAANPQVVGHKHTIDYPDKVPRFHKQARGPIRTTVLGICKVGPTAHYYQCY